MKIVFATNNQHKLKEIQTALENKLDIKGLSDIDCFEELPENQSTLEGNAEEKARYIYTTYGINCFADDTGLEIEALNGEPGVYSARYAGDQKNAKENMKKVLQKMEHFSNRKARFRTIIALLIDGELFRFEGIVNGNILRKERGSDGFGYDPIFEPEGYQLSFAEMPLEEKNKISHRGQAVQKLLVFLKENYVQ